MSYIDDLPRPTIETMKAWLQFEELIKAGDRGTNQYSDIIFQTADGADLGAMWDEFQQTLQLWNKYRSPLINLLTYTVNNPVDRVLYPTQDDFEQATEYGEPKGIRLGTPFNMGFPFQWWDLAIRYTWLFLAEADQRQVEALNNQALDADQRLYFVRILRALFNNVNEMATVKGQPVNVYRLYNADGMVPPTYKTTSFDGTHNHYLTSGASTMDQGDITDMEDHLYHHGYNVQNGYRLILLVNRQEGKIIRGLRVASGAQYDFIPNGNVGGGVIIPLGTIVGNPEGTVPGQIGTYGPFHVIEEDYIPAGYTIALASGGEENIGNPVGIREHENAALGGLKLVKGPQPDYPLVDSFYRHGFGAGIRHRGAGVVMKITSGSYTIPAAYA